MWYVATIDWETVRRFETRSEAMWFCRKHTDYYEVTPDVVLKILDKGGCLID